jgi:hypothetical protein
MAQLSNDTVTILLAVASGVLFFSVVAGLFVLPILIWRNRVRREGYPGLRAYLRELPQTEEEKLDAVELALKGVVLCVLGILFPPLMVIGLVPLYYGLRKLASLKLGIKGAAHDSLGD